MSNGDSPAEEVHDLQTGILEEVIEGGDLDLDKLWKITIAFKHAPSSLTDDFDRILEVIEAAEEYRRWKMIVISVDIRKSNILMKEAVGPDSKLSMNQAPP